MIAKGDRHEPCPRRVRACGARKREDPLARKRPDRQVVVAGPAEATQVGAAANDLDQEARPEFGVGREDARRRRINSVGRFDRGFADHGGRACSGLRHIARDRAVGSVFDIVERRHIEAARVHQLPKEVVARGGGLRCGDKRWNQRFTLAGSDDVGEERQRLRVHECHGAANHDERVVAACDRRRAPECRPDEEG